MSFKKYKRIISAAFPAVLAAAFGIRSAANRGLHVFRYEVRSPKLPAEFDGLRIVQLSDLHDKYFGENDEELLRRCRALRPDVIFFTGDMISRTADKDRVLSRLPLIRGLIGIAPVYYIKGNHESDAPRMSELLTGLLKRSGIRVLENEKTRLFRGKASIDLYGLVLPPEYYRTENGTYRSLPEVTEQVLEGFLGTPDRERFSLLLAHNPLPFRSYAGWGADLTFSGHIHGGIIMLFGRGLLSPERKFFPRYTRGLYRAGDSQMIVSSGLGKMRINNPEMIALCILKKQI